jgi:hypothetical protein
MKAIQEARVMVNRLVPQLPWVHGFPWTQMVLLGVRR